MWGNDQHNESERESFVTRQNCISVIS